MKKIEVWRDRHGSWTAQCGRYREELDLEPEAHWHELIESAREASEND